jgi:hypothetical protein
MPKKRADLNGIKWEDLVDFYKHEQNWSQKSLSSGPELARILQPRLKVSCICGNGEGRGK